MRLREKFGIPGVTIGLVLATPDVAAAAFLSWQNEIGRQFGFALSSQLIEMTGEVPLAELFPLTAPSCTKYMFLPTNSEWTVFVDNGVLGTDAAGPMPVMAKRLGTRTIRATCSPHTITTEVARSNADSYGANILEVFDEQGETVRSIYCTNDGGKWKFGQTGIPFAFEKTNQYLVRRISERFTEEMINAYLASLAVNGFDENSYPGDGACSVLLRRKVNSAVSVEIGMQESIRRIS